MRQEYIYIFVLTLWHRTIVIHTHHESCLHARHPGEITCSYSPISQSVGLFSRPPVSMNPKRQRYEYRKYVYIWQAIVRSKYISHFTLARGTDFTREREGEHIHPTACSRYIVLLCLSPASLTLTHHNSIFLILCQERTRNQVSYIRSSLRLQLILERAWARAEVYLAYL